MADDIDLHQAAGAISDLASLRFGVEDIAAQMNAFAERVDGARLASGAGQA